MSTTTDLTTLKINYLTQAQYEAAVAQGLINSNELYFTPEMSNWENGSGTDSVQIIGTTAGYANQATIGKYNDNQSNTAFEIGNGTSSASSNAFTVDWSGEVELALDTSAQSGTDKDIYDALVALGWDSDVIV